MTVGGVYVAITPFMFCMPVDLYWDAGLWKLETGRRMRVLMDGRTVAVGCIDNTVALNRQLTLRIVYGGRTRIALQVGYCS